MKLKQFQKELIKQKTDVVLLFNNEHIDSNVFYFTQTDIKNTFLLIFKRKNPIYVVSDMEFERAKKFSKVKNIVSFSNSKDFEKIMLKNLKGKNIGINFSFASIDFFNRLKKNFKPKKTSDISFLLRQLRFQKTTNEINLIKTANRISEHIFLDTIKNFTKFKTETDVSDFMEQKMKKYQVMPSFPTIVASGKNSSMPHHETSRSRLQKGFCIIDFGVNYKGYCSDITRTIYLGDPSQKELEIYYFLLNIQKEAIKRVNSGKKLDEFDKEIRGFFKNYSKNFIHGIGHSLGIDVHDAALNRFWDGCVFTIEPGIYFRGKYGIRIEDDILVTKKGSIEITHLKKDLIVLNH